MTAITLTADMSLRDIISAVYLAAPEGIDYTVAPDGAVTFTDEARPAEQFRIGRDTEYAGEDVDGVVWAVWTVEEDQDTGQFYEDFAGADGCNLADPTDLVTALTRWIDAAGKVQQ